MLTEPPESVEDLARYVAAAGESPNVDAKGPLLWDGGDASAGLAKAIMAANAHNRGALVEIVGDSLAPVALHGQHVFVDLSDRSVRNGDLVVVETKDGSVYAKRAFLRNKVLLLTSVNPLGHLKPIEVPWDQIERAYVIVGVWFE